MIIYKNKFFVKSEKYPDTDFAGDADWVIPDDSDLADKIIRLYPNFEFVFDDDGNISDVVGVEPTPVPPAPPSDHERLEALEAAFIEFVSEVV